MRLWAYGLTADEWLHLAAEGEDSEVPPCCGNISNVRELLNALAVSQAAYDDVDWMRMSLGRELLELLGDTFPEDGYGHDLNHRDTFPLLHRVLEGVREEMSHDSGKTAL